MLLPPTVTSLGDAARADWVIAGAAMKVMARATAVMRVPPQVLCGILHIRSAESALGCVAISPWWMEAIMPSSMEDRETHIRRGQEAWQRHIQKGDATWNDWMAIGDALLIGREDALIVGSPAIISMTSTKAIGVA